MQTCYRHLRVVLRTAVGLLLIGLGSLSTLSGCTKPTRTLQSHVPVGSMVAYVESSEPVVPLATHIRPLDDKAILGKLLFHDPRLSRDNSISCASCHEVAHGGDDGRQFSVGIGGAIGAVNSPTVLNASFNVAQFWDGRASDLKAQVAGPIHAPGEMGSSWSEVIGKLQADPDMVMRFRRLFPAGITAESITDSIVAYETQLVTPNSPFDRYLHGDQTAVDARVIQGYHLFKELGCAACHQGKNVGGNLFAKFGVMREFSEHTTDTPLNSDSTGTEVERIKVPALRNVALTGPYLHDGSAETLADAVAVMGVYQLGTELTVSDIELIVKFLESLTGVLSEELK